MIGTKQNPGNHGRTQELHKALRHDLLALPFHSFEQCVGSVLAAMGYTDIRIPRESKGRNRDGGWDIQGTFHTGFGDLRMIGQIKQYNSVRVQKRYVDELRGGMLRENANQGVLVTLSTFSDTARKAANSGTVAPVRLIDGDELVQLMIAHGIGIVSNVRRSTAIGSSQLHRPTSGRKPNNLTKGRMVASSSPVTVVVKSAGRPRIEWDQTP